MGKEHKYYALIKGHELIDDEGYLTCKYWNLSGSNGNLFPSHRIPGYGAYFTEMTKVEWNELGINDSNADFVKVDD